MEDRIIQLYGILRAGSGLLLRSVPAREFRPKGVGPKDGFPSREELVYAYLLVACLPFSFGSLSASWRFDTCSVYFRDKVYPIFKEFRGNKLLTTRYVNCLKRIGLIHIKGWKITFDLERLLRMVRIVLRTYHQESFEWLLGYLAESHLLWIIRDEPLTEDAERCYTYYLLQLPELSDPTPIFDYEDEFYPPPVAGEG